MVKMEILAWKLKIRFEKLVAIQDTNLVYTPFNLHTNLGTLAKQNSVSSLSLGIFFVALSLRMHFDDLTTRLTVYHST